MNKLVVTTALVASLAAGGIFYAQTSNAANDAPAAAESKEATKKPLPSKVQLPPDKAKLYNETMKQAAEGNQSLRDQIQKVRAEADALLVADKFDRKAYLAKAEELDKLYDKARVHMNEAFVSIAEKFSLEERKLLLANRNARQQQQQNPAAAQPAAR